MDNKEATLESKLKAVGVDIKDLWRYNPKTGPSIGYRLYQQHDVDYHGAIRECILHSNYKTLHHMWDAIYYCDRDCPDFESNLELALKSSDVATVLVCLYGYANYYVYNSYENHITFQKMDKWAFRFNPGDTFKQVLAVVAELKEVCDNHLFYEGDFDADDFDEQNEIHNKKRNKWLKIKLIENDVDLHELTEEFQTSVKAIRAAQ